MEAAAHQRQVRLNRRGTTVGEAQTTKQESQVHFVQFTQDQMVKVAVENIFRRGDPISLRVHGERMRCKWRKICQGDGSESIDVQGKDPSLPGE